jgi:hypothetical protein
MKFDQLVNEILNEGIFSFGKPNPVVLKYVEKMENIAESGEFGPARASEFFYNKVPSALWKQVIKAYEKRNSSSSVTMLIKQKIGQKSMN